jgi:hypothetical protein
VTNPLCDTVATDASVELHVTDLPLRVTPFTSRVTALACDVSTIEMVVRSSDTVTDATGTGTTVTVALPVFPSPVAMMCAVPIATPVTTPVEFTVAINGASELHEIARPLKVAPLAANVVAVACVVWPV